MIDKELSLELYITLCVIRISEEGIIKYYSEDDMKTPMHMSMGSEAISAGVCQALGKEGQLLSTYRTHASYLAKTHNIDGFFSELYARKNGCAKGKSGSMHLSDPDVGHMGSSAIVGTVNPVAVGCAFANKYLHQDRMMAVFFGDGAVNEGAFWESLNLACLMRLPVIFICENNNLAVHTYIKDRNGFPSLDKIVSEFDCVTAHSSSTDVEEILSLTLDCMDRMKSSKRPGFMQLEYCRYLEHVGVSSDWHEDYRDQLEYAEWLQKDPILMQKNKLLKLGFSESYLQSIKDQIQNDVDNAIVIAKNTSPPDADEIYRDVFHEDS